MFSSTSVVSTLMVNNSLFKVGREMLAPLLIKNNKLGRSRRPSAALRYEKEQYVY